MVRSLQGIGEVAALTRQQCDLDNPAEAARRVADIRPDIVINAAAYTAVDAAETDSDAAYRATRDGPALRARLCAAAGIPL